MEEVVRDFTGNMVSLRKGKNLFCSTSNPYDSIDSLLYSLNRRDNSFDFIITPRNRITNLNFEANPGEFHKWSIEAIEPYCVRKEDLEKVFQKEKRKEENKMADANKILYVYEDIVSKKIREHYGKKIEEADKESVEAKIAQKAREFALKELKKTFTDYDETKENLIVIDYNLRGETKKIISGLENERRKDLVSLDERITEIRAMLELAQTFDEKMQVLKAYEVVDKKGVIIK